MAVQLNYDEINKRRKASGTTGVSNVSDVEKMPTIRQTELPRDTSYQDMTTEQRSTIEQGVQQKYDQLKSSGLSKFGATEQIKKELTDSGMKGVKSLTPLTGETFTQEQKTGAKALKDTYLSQGYSPADAERMASATYTTGKPTIPQKDAVGTQPTTTPTGVTPITATDTTTTVTEPTKTEKDLYSDLSTEDQTAYSQLDKAKKDYYNALIAQGNYEEAKSTLKKDLDIQKEKTLGKQIGESMSDLERENTRLKEMNKIKADQNIRTAEDKHKALVENASYFKGAVGFPQTKVALDAQATQLQRSQQLVNDIINLERLNAEGLADEYSSKMRDLQEKLDLNVSQAVQKQLVNLNLLASTGQLDSMEAITKAKQDLYNVLNDEVGSLVKNNVDLMKQLSDDASERVKEFNESRKYDNNITEQMADGFLYNSMGQRMTDSSGMPIKGKTGKKINSTIDNKDGTVTVLYQDGSYESIKAGQDLAKIPDEAVTKIFNNNYVYDRFGNIITDANGQPVSRVPETDKPQTVVDPITGAIYQYNAQTNTWSPIQATQGGGGTQTPPIGGTQPVQPTTPQAFIASKEGFRETPYWDVNGWAIGYGQHSINGKPVQQGDRITREQADADMANRLANQKWSSLIKVPLSESQKAALASFEWNLGGGIWTKKDGGAQEVINKINAGDFAGAGEEMKKFNRAGGVINNGLVSRRNEEAGLLSQQVAETEGFSTKNTPIYKKFLESGNVPDAKELFANGYGTGTQALDKFKNEALSFSQSEAYKELNKLTQKPLSGDAAKVVAYTNTGINEANKILQKLNTMDAREFITRYKAGDPEITPIVNNMIDSIIRIRTGAAATKQEMDNFASGIASNANLVVNNKQSIIDMVNTYKNEFSTVRSSMGVNTETAGSIGVPAQGRWASSKGSAGIGAATGRWQASKK